MEIFAIESLENGHNKKHTYYIKIFIKFTVKFISDLFPILNILKIFSFQCMKLKKCIRLLIKI